MPTGGVFKEEIGSVKKSPTSKYSPASSSSSIGKNSDLSGDEEEVQSSCDKGALDAMEALEEVLPIRRGISSFYNGKSKSYASLAYVSSSTRDIAKPDNAYTRKRRNQLSRALFWEDKDRGLCGLSKRSKTSLALGDTSDKRDGECMNSGGSSMSSLSSADFSPWRAFSSVDLQRYACDAGKTDLQRYACDARKTCLGLDSNPLV